MQLTKRVKKYLREHWDQRSCLLLGYSGGPDSKALLYCLSGLKVPLHVAHVDHGWREESAAETEMLRAEVQKLGLPFHSTRLLSKPDKNLEDFARQQRLAFFRSLQTTVPFQALVLAHHADDAAETVLKRLFEGAHLPHLGGMSSRSEIEGLTIFRPLLTTRKSEILSYLEQHSLTALHDKTNDDPAFLRTRLRKDVVPALAEMFGKEIGGNLLILAERAFELKAYLEKRVAERWSSRKQTEDSVQVDLTGLERIEARYLVQKAAASLNLVVPRRVLEQYISQDVVCLSLNTTLTQ